MTKDQFKEICRVVMPTLAALGCLAGFVTMVGTITFDALPVALKVKTGEAYPLGPWITGSILLLIALVAGIWTLVILKPIESGDMRADSDATFTRYLIGIGYFLFVDAVVNMVAIAGIAHSGRLEQIFPVGDGALKSEPVSKGAVSWLEGFLRFFGWTDSEKPTVLTVILMLSLGMALLGALLYFAKALWNKFDAQIELFDRNVFWGGLWFRLAEAIVFTIALFLFFQFRGANKTINYLPMIGLLVGLTVKSSEALIFGLAERVLASITGLIEGRPATPAPPAAPALTITKIKPTKARPGGDVTVEGSSFGPTQAKGGIVIDGVLQTPPITVKSWTDTAITFALPGPPMPQGWSLGKKVLRVRREDGTDSNSVSFELLRQGPSIAGLAAAHGALTLKGADFGTSSGTVKINDKPSQVKSWADTSITLDNPDQMQPGATVSVKVFLPDDPDAPAATVANCPVS
jgi:hypothetical protein